MNTAAIPTKNKELPINEQLTFIREEVNALFPGTYTGAAKHVAGTFRQQYGNLIFWYNQWDKNRDYSSAVNVSMALGKLGNITEMLKVIPDFRADWEMIEAIINALDKILAECWNNIQKAAGRIVPFQE